MDEEAYKIINPHLPSELDAALRWLDELGVAYSRARFQRYKETLNSVESSRVKLASVKIGDSPVWEKDDSLRDIALRRRAFPALFEANELAMICGSLMGKGLEAYLRPRLEELASGPDSYVDEKSGRSKARDTGFELSVMAQLSAAGIAIQQHYGLADIVARLGATNYIVECKRLQSEAGVPQAIRRARTQLRTRYLQAQDATGFIAIDVTKIFNPKLLVPTVMSPQEIVPRINERMRSLLRRHLKHWERIEDDRTAGILVRDSVLAWSHATNEMTFIHKYAIIQVPGRSVLRQATVRKIEDALNRASGFDGIAIL